VPPNAAAPVRAAAFDGCSDGPVMPDDGGEGQEPASARATPARVRPAMLFEGELTFEGLEDHLDHWRQLRGLIRCVAGSPNGWPARSQSWRPVAASGVHVADALSICSPVHPAACVPGTFGVAGCQGRPVASRPARFLVQLRMLMC
jgi:hypothetical protein